MIHVHAEVVKSIKSVVADRIFGRISVKTYENTQK